MQRCPFGEAYVHFSRVRDIDRMVRDSPHQVGDGFLTFVKHNEGKNWRRTYFNRTCWLMLTGVPFDYWSSEDLSLAVCKFGKLIMWEKDETRRGRLLLQVRVSQLIDIPKSPRWSEGEDLEEDTWSCFVDALLEEMLEDGLADEDPIPPLDVGPHPLPEDEFPGLQPLENNQNNVEDENEGWDLDDHWAFPHQEAQNYL